MELDRDIFPFVNPSMGMSPHAMGCISHHASASGFKALAMNHVRFISQPMGYVAWAVDVDLLTGMAIRHPGTHERFGIRKGLLDCNRVAALNGLLISDAFQSIPSESPAWGFDGTSQFIEVDLDGHYSWKCHWNIEEDLLGEVGKLFWPLSKELLAR